MSEAGTKVVKGTAVIAVECEIFDAASKDEMKRKLRRQAKKGNFDQVLDVEIGVIAPHD